MRARGLFLLQCKQNKEPVMEDFLIGTLQLVFNAIFDIFSEIYRGALEGMFNRINGWYW
jgi:hypothetical protein